MVSSQTQPVVDTKALIVQAVAKKQGKGGSAYARGKTLVVFLYAGGTTWWPDQITRELPSHDFDAVWVVALQSVEDGAYNYGVTRLEHVGALWNSPFWPVRIMRYGATIIGLAGRQVTGSHLTTASLKWSTTAAIANAPPRRS